jgi:sigma-B regulation protein RsbU (phosphoserine phosphatase)
MLRIFLVDDEPPARARMRQLLADESDVLVIGEAADAIEARDAIAASHPDVVFLDVEMPEVSGTTLARALPEPRPFIVFATAFDRYAIDAFALEATDYLVKPITGARLSTTLARIRERLARRTDLERELAAASVTQAALLPRTIPDMPGFEAAAVTLPARGVGGDFLVAQRLADDRVILALGDVSGKGMPAGLIASSLQARFEAVARHTRGDAGEVVAEVNRTLCASSEGSRFATLVYLEIDPGHHAIAMVNAGHPAPLLLGADGVPVRYESTGPALGLLPEAMFRVHRFTMASSDTLFTYSDGVTEAFNAEEDEFGESRLLGVLREHAAAPASTLCRVVIDAVRQHADGYAGDDITVLALRR